MIIYCGYVVDVHMSWSLNKGQSIICKNLFICYFYWLKNKVVSASGLGESRQKEIHRE